MAMIEDIGAAMARLTGLEPATSGVTGRHSNQLSYNRPLPTRLTGCDALLSGSGGGVKRPDAAIAHFPRAP